MAETPKLTQDQREELDNLARLAAHAGLTATRGQLINDVAQCSEPFFSITGRQKDGSLLEATVAVRTEDEVDFALHLLRVMVARAVRRVRGEVAGG